MDDDFSQLEGELKRLRPRAPSALVAHRVERSLRPRLSRHRLWWMLPLAAAAAVALALRPGRVAAPGDLAQTGAVAPTPSLENPPAPSAVFKPVAVENVLYAAHDDGVVTLDDGRTARRTRRSYVDTVLWRDPKSNASLTWSVPRSEVVVTPVSFQ